MIILLRSFWSTLEDSTVCLEAISKIVFARAGWVRQWQNVCLDYGVLKGEGDETKDPFKFESMSSESEPSEVKSQGTLKPSIMGWIPELMRQKSPMKSQPKKSERKNTICASNFDGIIILLKQKVWAWCWAMRPGATWVPNPSVVSPSSNRYMFKIPESLTSKLIVPSWKKFQ